MTKYNAKATWCDSNLEPCSKENSVFKFKSKLEWDYAKMLKLCLRSGEITGWLYEPPFFNFNERAKTPYHAHSIYTPDFLVLAENSHYYVECKGYNPAGSLTKIRRFLKHFPEHELRVYSRKHGTLLAVDYLKLIKRRK